MRFSSLLVRSTLSALAFVAFAVAADADVLVVAAGGAAPFTEIQAAVDAASDGDVILVKSGVYSSFVTRNVDLSIVADVGQTVQIDGAIRVGAIASTRTLLLSGLRATGSNSLGGSARHGLNAQNADGLVLVQDCQLLGATHVASVPCSFAGAGAHLTQCRNVAFVRCELRGGGPQPSGSGSIGNGGAGMESDDSNVALYGTSVLGGSAGLYVECTSAYGYGDGGNGGHGIVRTSPATSALFAANTTVAGGAGADGVDPVPNCSCTFGGSGGNAVLGAPNAGWVQSSIGGGLPGIGTCALGCGGSFGYPSPAITFAGTARTVAARNPIVAREGQTLQLSIRGLSGDQVELVWVQRNAFALSPALDGVRHYSLRHPQPVMPLGVIPGGNALPLAWNVAELGAGVQGTRVLYQPVHRAASGEVKQGQPFAVVLLDSAY